MKFICGLLGGTFDHLHLGHQSLIKTAADACDRIEIHLVNDQMAKLKGADIEPYVDRVAAIIEFANSSGFHEKLSIHPLLDKHGPAPVRADCHLIACTPETVSRCEEINQIRQHSGLQPLHILVVEHVIGVDGEVISSSRIRSGSIDLDGTPWFDLEELQESVSMPSDLDAELKQPMGTLHSGPEAEPQIAIRAALEQVAELDQSLSSIIAVGDVTVAALIGAGITPHIAVIDGMTKRQPWVDAGTIDTTKFVRHLNCTNPAGMLTRSLAEVCVEGLSELSSCLIEVQGEEDLSPIILILLAPLRSHIMYGQPNAGVVVRIVDIESKKRARTLLDAFVKPEKS